MATNPSLRGLWWYLPAWLTPQLAVTLDSHRDRIDRFGDRIHLCLACVTMFFLAWPATPVDIALGALNGCFLVRLWFLRRMFILYCLQAPAILCLIAAAWQGSTLLWTEHMRQGIEQWGAWRCGLLMFSLYPVVHRSGLLIIMLLLGFLCGNAVQAATAIGVATDQQWMVLWQPVAEGRISGWWPPVIGGGVLVGCLGLHLGGLWRARGNVMLFPLLGVAASIAGIVATGTRGAWIGAASTVILWSAAFLLSRVPQGRRVRFACGAAALVAVFALIGYVAAKPAIDRRITDTRNEVNRALHGGEYHTNIGLRIKMLQWGIEAARTAPLTGVGSGDFRDFVLTQRPLATGNEAAAIDLFDAQGHGHSHNTPLHALATTGIPGMLLLMLLLVSALYAGFVLPGPPPRPQTPPLLTDDEHFSLLTRLETTYAACAPWGLLAMCTLMPFEVITTSLQPAAITFACAALCPGWRRLGTGLQY